MNVIQPLTITDAILTASNVTENDHAVWSGATAYTIGTRVILTTGYHKIYEAIAASTNKHPVTDPAAATYWLEVSATNRWKAFDQKIGQQVSRGTSITYTFAPTSTVDRMAFFGLSASSINITVKDSTTAIVADIDIDLVDRTDAVTWFTWLMDPIKFDTEALSIAFPGYVGNTIEVTITATGTAKVGQIVLGRTQKLGETSTGTEVGFTDYSIIERDDFGTPTIVPRAYTDLVTYNFTFPDGDARRVKRVITALRGVPAVFFSGTDDINFGTLIYGIHKGFSAPLQTSVVFATLEIEGLT